MTRVERQELFEDMQTFGIKRFQQAPDGSIEVEALPPAPRKAQRELDDEPSGMPTREELWKLKEKIDAAPRVGPPKGP